MNPKAKRNAILGQAQRLANSGQFAEAVNQLELLRRTDPDLARWFTASAWGGTSPPQRSAARVL